MVGGSSPWRSGGGPRIGIARTALKLQLALGRMLGRRGLKGRKKLASRPVNFVITSLAVVKEKIIPNVYYSRCQHRNSMSHPAVEENTVISAARYHRVRRGCQHNRRGRTHGLFKSSTKQNTPRFFFEFRGQTYRICQTGRMCVRASSHYGAVRWPSVSRNIPNLVSGRHNARMRCMAPGRRFGLSGALRSSCQKCLTYCQFLILFLLFS